MTNQRERYKVEFITNPRGNEVLMIYIDPSHDGGLESLGIFSHGVLELHGSVSLSQEE
jgi:hypothetical protein